MYDLSNQSRSDSYCEIQWENGDFAINSAGQVYDRNLLAQANTVKLSAIFKKYNIIIDSYNKTISCPLPNHSKDSTPSFKYYPDTNSFYCFGCKSGVSPIHFVSLMENCTQIEAAQKLINDFNTTIPTKKLSDINIKDSILTLSTIIRETYQKYECYPKKIKELDKICLAFDNIVSSYNEPIVEKSEIFQRVIDKIKERIDNI